MTDVSRLPGDEAHQGLVVRGVSKRFGVTQALDRIDLDVRPGEVVALLGENGAGKSTLSNIVAGTFPSDTGHMAWQGRPYEPRSPGTPSTTGSGSSTRRCVCFRTSRSPRTSSSADCRYAADASTVPR